MAITYLTKAKNFARDEKDQVAIKKYLKDCVDMLVKEELDEFDIVQPKSVRTGEHARTKSGDITINSFLLKIGADYGKFSTKFEENGVKTLSDLKQLTPEEIKELSNLML